jgi:hypothetical protein
MIEEKKTTRNVKLHSGEMVEVEMPIYRATYTRADGTKVSREFVMEFGAHIWLAQMDRWADKPKMEVLELTISEGGHVASAVTLHENGSSTLTPCEPVEVQTALLSRGWKKIDEVVKAGRSVQLWARRKKVSEGC